MAGAWIAPEIEEIDQILEEAEKGDDQIEAERRLMASIIGGMC